MKYTIALWIAITSQLATAQSENPSQSKNFLFKMSPQHLTMNMLKVGGERLNKSRTKSFQLYVQVVSNNKREDYAGSSFGHDGLGSEFMYKKYLLPFKELTNRKGRQFTQGIYFGGFIQGGYYKGNFRNNGFSWNPMTQTQISYTYDYLEKVSNGALGFTIGIQRLFWKVLTLDAYLGAGYQLSNQNITGTAPAWVTDFYDFNEVNYVGILPKFGLTIGVVL